MVDYRTELTSIYEDDDLLEEKLQLYMEMCRKIHFDVDWFHERLLVNDIDIESAICMLFHLFTNYKYHCAEVYDIDEEKRLFCLGGDKAPTNHELPKIIEANLPLMKPLPEYLGAGAYKMKETGNVYIILSRFHISNELTIARNYACYPTSPRSIEFFRKHPYLAKALNDAESVGSKPKKLRTGNK